MRHHHHLLFMGVCLMTLLAGSVTTFGQEIVAHRGASWDAPENTIAAFELAWERDADAVEGDFFLTGDGKIVCLHDRTTGRTADRDLVIADTPLAELQQLDVGTWKGEEWAGERPPTLEESLATVPPGKRFFVEIKSGVEIMDALVETLTSTHLEPEQIVIISFHAEVIAECRRRLPHLTANWLVSFRQNEETGAWTPALPQVFATLERINASGLSTHANAEVMTERVVAELRRRDLEFHVWTVNNVEQAEHFRSLGVDSITTDRPGYIRRHLGIPVTAPVEAGEP